MAHVVESGRVCGADGRISGRRRGRCGAVHRGAAAAVDRRTGGRARRGPAPLARHPRGAARRERDARGRAARVHDGLRRVRQHPSTRQDDRRHAHRGHGVARGVRTCGYRGGKSARGGRGAGNGRRARRDVHQRARAALAWHDARHPACGGRRERRARCR